jgi:hypothetical protein
MVYGSKRCSMQQKSKGRRLLSRGYQLHVPAIFSVTLPLETTAAGGCKKKLREKKGGHFAGGKISAVVKAREGYFFMFLRKLPSSHSLHPTMFPT